MRGRNRLIVSGVVYDLTPEIAEGLFSCYQNLKRKHGRASVWCNRTSTEGGK